MSLVSLVERSKANMRLNKRYLTSLLLPLLLISSCGKTQGPPVDYELKTGVNNVPGGAYYEIFVRSFADTDNNGIGDIQGVTGKLDYLKDLGVGGIWLMPIHPSPSYHGYDVDDYTAVNEDYGTLADVEELTAVAEEKNIDVIIDLVINHSSRNHPWFVEGIANFRSGNFSPSDNDNKANWYNFYWESGQVKYEAGFGDWMPDLNLDNPAVRAEIQRISDFWLDKGVDGFRLDAVTYYYTNQPQKSVAFLQWFEGIVRAKNPNAYIVGEAWKDQGTINSYYEGIDSLFNFPGAGSGGYIIDNITSKIGSTLAFQIAKTYREAKERNPEALVASFLTNHDMDRSAQMYILDQELRQKLAASVYLLTPGVPFLYYGEEIGLKGTRGSAMTDANRRLPMQWQKNLDSWRTDMPDGATYTNQIREGAFDLLEVPFSLINHYKKLLNIRNQYAWLNYATVEQVQLANNMLAGLKFSDRAGIEKPIYVVHNVDNIDQEIDLDRLNSEVSDYVILHDIFTNQIRAKMNQQTITLGAYSSVVIGEK